MSRIIAIINQKGGVGKTATACNLSYCLAKKEKRTLLIDLDSSANATRIFLKNISQFTVRDFLLGKNGPENCIYDAVQHEVISNLAILPSHISLAMAERELSNKPFRELVLSKKLNLKPLKNIYDYIIIDCPPTLSTLTVNAMFAANHILIPVTYQRDALEGVADLFKLLNEIKENHDYKINILRNQFDARKKVANTFVNGELDPFIEEKIVLNTIIRQDEEVNKASINDLTVISAAPSSNAAMDYFNLCDELLRGENHD